MAGPKWFEGRMLGFDTETTGTSVHEDRIVTAALIYAAPGTRPASVTYVINPGVDIPAEAAAVHGWTNDGIEQYLAEHEAERITSGKIPMPMTREQALVDIADRLAQAMQLEYPVVAANAAFDFSLTEAELARAGADSLYQRAGGVRGVVDPMVLDKQWDPYRKACYKKGPDGTPCDKENDVHHCGGCRGGKHQCRGCGATDRKLSSLAAHYGVFLGNAHDAGADALAAVRLAARLGSLWKDAGRLKLSTVHAKQVEWRAEQMAGLREWFDKAGIEHDGCCGEWPVHTACAPVGAGVSA